MTAEVSLPDSAAPAWEGSAHMDAMCEELARARLDGSVAARILDFAGALFRQGYLTSPSHTIGIYSAIVTNRPLLFFGLPGCGKTFFAEVATRIFNPGQDVLGVSCHEQILPEHFLWREDETGRRLLWERLDREARSSGRDLDWDEAARQVQSRIIAGPLLQAIEDGNLTGRPRVVLIDEIDKAREAAEAPLLDFLNSGRVIVPYVGVFESTPGAEPIVVLTANKLRRLSEALESRVFAVEVQLPTILEEDYILANQVPELDHEARRRLLLFTYRIREELRMNPVSIREARYMARALAALGVSGPDRITADLLISLGGLYAKNGPDREMFDLHAADCWAWVLRQAGRHDGLDDLLAGLDRHQRHVRRETVYASS